MVRQKNPEFSVLGVTTGIIMCDKEAVDSTDEC